MRFLQNCAGNVHTGGRGVHAASLEQFSELRDARNGTPPHSILCFAALQVRPAPCFALAPLAKKTLRLFGKCSRGSVLTPEQGSMNKRLPVRVEGRRRRGEFQRRVSFRCLPQVAWTGPPPP
ncbi:hypothetical protein DVJ83_05610 [Deinococcus wulumuqiensis]|uniref:Uncharacterized protein n=1 Tax=Deinococcus wulumuqiensis TaxID=980427 RepID=A0A345IK30_9DEIO|nr:hypothetical protein DVJ83_05610 [Deinococcus wulumuqiensis]